MYLSPLVSSGYWLKPSINFIVLSSLLLALLLFFLDVGKGYAVFLKKNEKFRFHLNFMLESFCNRGGNTKPQRDELRKHTIINLKMAREKEVKKKKKLKFIVYTKQYSLFNDSFFFLSYFFLQFFRVLFLLRYASLITHLQTLNKITVINLFFWMYCLLWDYLPYWHYRPIVSVL